MESIGERNHEEEEYFMRKALGVAKAALDQGEVPVGCVIVLRDAIPPSETRKESSAKESYDYLNSPHVIVSHGANQVNATRDATRHAEIIAIDRMLTGSMMSDHSRLPQDVILKASHGQTPHGLSNEFKDEWKHFDCESQENHWKQNYGYGSGRLYNKDILKSCSLYVTCEPCIMCAAALARVGIGRVFYGCKNNRFGGCESMLHLHQQTTLPSKEHVGYPIISGILEDEAVNLLRSFYDRENFHAPDDKRKRKPSPTGQTQDETSNE